MRASDLHHLLHLTAWPGQIVSGPCHRATLIIGCTKSRRARGRGGGVDEVQLLDVDGHATRTVLKEVRRRVVEQTKGLGVGVSQLDEQTITGRFVLGDALAADSAPSPDQTRGLRVADYSRPYVDEFRTAVIELGRAA
jgi:hypothetical protein